MADVDHLTLPTFLVIGAPKCGTTTLHDHLDSHPNVEMSAVKEPAFFSNDTEYGLGLTHYASYFHPRPPTAAIGEATPWYLYDIRAARRIIRDLPPASHRFVIILRDPIDRAHSMYWDQRHGLREHRTFMDAVEEDMARSGWPERHAESVRSYARCGRYEVFIERYLELVPEEQILTLFMDDLRAERSARRLFEDLARFIGVPSEPLWSEALRRSNVGSAVRSERLALWLNPPGDGGDEMARRLARTVLPRRYLRRLASRVAEWNRRSMTYPPLPEQHRQRLAAYYAPTVEYLRANTDRDLAAWSG